MKFKFRQAVFCSHSLPDSIFRRTGSYDEK